MMQTHHNFSLFDLENMIPFERDIYCQFIQEKLEKQKQAARNLI